MTLRSYGKITALAVLLSACGQGTDRQTERAPQATREAPAGPALVAASTDGEALTAVARLLAGLADTPPEGSQDEPQREVRARHAEAMAAIWAELEARHLGPMRAWAETALADLEAPEAPLVYPFGGPDLLSAAQFFPAASSYVLVGLEPPGKIPDLAGLDAAGLEAELERLRGGLEHLVTAGYFVTTRMERDFAPAEHRLDGFLPVLFLFLARSGERPAAVRYVDFADDGEVRHLAEVDAGTARAVEVELAGQDADPPRRLYYVAQDLSNDGLAQAPGVVRFLSRLGGFNVYLKSASYLLHMPEFTVLRDRLLAEGRTILQDDSGVPLRYFAPRRWRLRLYGAYTQTLPAYREWFQDDLRAAFAADDAVEPLPFAIGYHSQIGGSSLIRADRLPEPWWQFRGPTGDGRAPRADLPTTWSEGENVTWKTALPGRGWSSPVVLDGAVWLTTGIEDGHSLHALAVDAERGGILHDVELFRPGTWGGAHAENSYASPTPVAEDGRVYVHFGAYGSACLDASDGRVIWRIPAFDFDHEHGPGSSPVLFEDLLIFNFDGAAERFVAAFDKRTGEKVWKTPRSAPLEHHLYAFTTPLVVDVAGSAQLVSAGAGQVGGYDPRTGEELWRVRYEGHSNVPRPVAGLGLVFVNTGYMKPHLLAIRPDGRGDVTDSHVVWDYHWQVSANPSPLLIGERLFFVSDWGIATWLDALRGEDVWRQRLGGRHYASPIYAHGRVYTFSIEGETRVIVAGDVFEELAVNRLDGEIRASPAVIGDALIVRTDRHLYRIEAR